MAVFNVIEQHQALLKENQVCTLTYLLKGVCVGNVCFSGSVICTHKNARFEMSQDWGLVLSSIWRKNSYLDLDSSDKFSLKDNNLVFLVNVNTVTALCKRKNK